MANQVFISQSGAGSQTGVDVANAKPATYFNTSGNWSATPTGIQIGPDTVVQLVGTFTSTLLTFQGSGSSGHPVTLVCAAGGCNLTAPAASLLNLNGESHLVIDGGFACGPAVNAATCTGVAQNTANGSSLANQIATRFIDGANNSGDIEIRNWNVKGLYVHTSLTDVTIDETQSNLILANPISGNLHIHDLTVKEVGWAILTEGYTNAPLIKVNNVNFINYNHGVAIGVQNNVDVGSVEINDNHFGPTANWDTTADAYHHDGTHFFSSTTWNPSWTFTLWNNLFDGDWGIDNTTHIFCEEQPPNVVMFNNVHVQAAGNTLNDGMIACATAAIYNSTYVGANVSLQIGLSTNQITGGPNMAFRNNVISGVNVFMNMSDTTTFATGSPSNDIYAAVVSGGSDPFIFNGVQLPNFGTWQSTTAGDAAPSAQVASANLNTAGVPNVGSVVIGAGVNLTGICSGLLTPLCSTTSNGGQLNSSPRPTSGPWDAGAFQFNTSPTIPTIAFGRFP